jgi:hypothetical protein
VPPRANADHFDVFDDTFRPQSAEGVVADGSLDSAVSYDSDAYNAFLRSDGLTGELSAMKNDWLRRMRLEIISVQHKYQKCCEAVKAHEASGGDPKDTTYGKNKFIAAETDKDRTTMSVDTEEGNVSAFKARRSFF